MNVFELFAKLSLDSSGYDEGLGTAEKEAQTFGQKLGGGLMTAAKIGGAALVSVGTSAAAAGTALVKGAGEVASYGDNIDKMSQKLGLSAEAYQQWDYVLGQAGADIDSMATGMKTLTNKLDDAKSGSASAQEMFAKLGISMEDVNTLSREDLFEKSIKGFQSMADSTERAALANDLFGKSGQELTPLFNSSIEDTEALLQASKDLGFVMSNDAVKASADYQDALDTMSRTFGGLKKSLISGFLPSMTTVMDGLTAIFSGDSEKGLGLIKEGISSILDSLTETIPQFIEIAGTILSALGQAILENIPQIIEVGTDILINLATGLIDALPQLAEAAITIIVTLVQTLIQKLPEVVAAGQEMLTSVSSGFEGNIPQMIKSAGTMLTKVVSYLLQNLPQFIQKGIEFISSMAQGVLNNLPEILGAIGEVIGELLSTIVSHLPELLEKGIELIAELAVGIIQAIPKVVAAIPEVIAGIVRGFGDKDWGSVGSDIISGVANGIWNGVSKVVEAAKGVAKRAFEAAKSFLGIASPSKLFRKQIGENISAGMALGIEDGMDDVATAIEDVASVDPYDVDVRSIGIPDGNVTTDNRSVVFNIYQQPGEDGEELARIIEDRLIQWDDQDRMVFA